jgi:hypothetical protein
MLGWASILTTWSPVPVQALVDEIGTDLVIDNSQADFADGVFQRTAVSAAPATPTNPDQSGAVELAPMGALSRENWKLLAAQLPLPLSNAPVVTLGKYLFVIAGATDADRNNGDSRSKYIFRGEVDQTTGTLVNVPVTGAGNDTFTATEIPALDPGVECRTSELSSRSGAAAVAVPVNNRTTLGYIFIVGGSMNHQHCGTYDFSTNIVQRATVASDGTITNWIGPVSWRFPTLDVDENIITDPDSPDLRGVQNLHLVYVRTSAGNSFLYALGGLSVAPSQLSRETIYRYVFYTKIDANGNLVHPTDLTSATVWSRLRDLPFPVHSGTAFAASTTTIEDRTPIQRDAIFLLGGCTKVDCTSLNTSVLRADVNPVTGELTWTDQVAKAGSGTQSINLQGRHTVTGISFNNRIYYVTGSTSQTLPGAEGATATIPVAVFDDRFLLEDIDPTNESVYFVGNSETSDYVLPLPNKRFGASATLIPARSGSNTNQVLTAWIYIIGGSNQQNQPTNTIFVGEVGGINETSGVIRASEGWYYSQPFLTLTNNETSRLLALKWLTELNRSSGNPSADIRLQFRAVVTSGTCRESDFDSSLSPSNPSRWREIDGDPDSEFFSRNGMNEVRLIEVFTDESVQATCMQYRVQLIQGGARTYSPKLLYFAVEKVLATDPDSKPDILIDTFDVQVSNGGFTNIVLTLRNLRKNSLAATRSVVAASGGGGFFVDLCIARRTNPDVPALTSVPAPNPNAGASATPACATVSAQVPKSPFIPGALYTVPLNDWVNSNNVEPANWNTIFGTPGTYDIGIVVDYNTMTGEDAEGRSNNRGESPSAPNGIIRTITIVAPPTPEPESIKVFVPVIYR